MTQKHNGKHEIINRTQDGRFDFESMFEIEVDGYKFMDDVQKRLFLEEIKSLVDHDTYIWNCVSETIAMAAGEIAEKMNLKEAE